MIHLHHTLMQHQQWSYRVCGEGSHERFLPLELELSYSTRRIAFQLTSTIIITIISRYQVCLACCRQKLFEQRLLVTERFNNYSSNRQLKYNCLHVIIYTRRTFRTYRSPGLLRLRINMRIK